MGKFRGWHIVAGIAAMVLTGILGTAMGLNNTAAFMSSCVAFVAVSLWVDSRISLRRRDAVQRRAQERARAAAPQAGPAGDPPEDRSEPDGELGAGQPEREGRGS